MDRRGRGCWRLCGLNSWRTLALSCLTLLLLIHMVGFQLSTRTKPGYGQAGQVPEGRGPSVHNRYRINKKTNVIVLSSNPRSGSSFVGELVSSAYDAAFFFEPLWYFIDTQKDLPTNKVKQELFKNLLTCNFRDRNIRGMLLSAKRSSFIFRKPAPSDIRSDDLLTSFGLDRVSFVKKMERRCRRTTLRVIKTIRMGLTEVADLVTSLPDYGAVSRSNLYVIYLVRDPRGTINSVQEMKSEWPARQRSPEYICTRMLNDSLLTNGSIPNLKVVRYEDVASRPMAEMLSLCTFLNISLPPESKRFVDEHITAELHTNRPTPSEDPVRDIFQVLAKQQQIQSELVEDIESEQMVVGGRDTPDYYDDKGKIATLKKRKRRHVEIDQKENQDPKGRSYYYSTYRHKGFRPDHWREHLSSQEQEAINYSPECRQVFQLYNYPPD